MKVPFESKAALLVTSLRRTSAPNFTLCFAALHVMVSENWYASVMRPCGKLLAPPIWKRPVIVTVGLTGSFSGKSRFRRTSENRNSFSLFDEKVCALLSARFVSTRSWKPA